MTKPNIKIDAESISGASSRIASAGDHAKGKTGSALHGVAKLSATAGHKVFAALVDGVLDELKAHLPDDIERLIKSYANGLIGLQNATGATDQALAEKWKTGDASPTSNGDGLAVLSVAAAGAGIAIQGSSPGLQGGSINIQGSSAPVQGSGNSQTSAEASSPAGSVAAGGQPTEKLPVEGPGKFANSTIVDTAKSWSTLPGKGGTCREFVSNVVSKATNGTVDLQAYTNPAHDYFKAFENCSVRITSVEDLRPGDIVQNGEWDGTASHPASPGLHTFIVDGIPYQKNGAWYVHCIDSNSQWDNTVREHDIAVALSGTERAYRLGSV